MSSNSTGIPLYRFACYRARSDAGAVSKCLKTLEAPVSFDRAWAGRRRSDV